MNKDDAAIWCSTSRLTSKEDFSRAVSHPQHALFIRRPSEAAGRRMTVNEIVIGEESLHRVFRPGRKATRMNSIPPLSF